MPEVPLAALQIVPVTQGRLDDLAGVFRGTDAATCWDMVQRTTAAEERDKVVVWKESGMSVREGRRSCFATLAAAAGTHAPGLIAYLADHPVGWISIGPRSDYPRVAMSRATPPVDDAHVWIIPCLLVRREHRSQGITSADRSCRPLRRCARCRRAGGLSASRRGPTLSIVGVPRDSGSVQEAGFEVVRAPLDGLPKAWVRRFAVRRTPLT